MVDFFFSMEAHFHFLMLFNHENGEATISSFYLNAIMLPICRKNKQVIRIFFVIESTQFILVDLCLFLFWLEVPSLNKLKFWFLF